MVTSFNITAIHVFQFISLLLTGLVAGLFYSYDCSVVKGLRSVGDNVYLQTFQSINRAIQNPYFFISFMGCLLMLPITTIFGYKGLNSTGFYLILSATIIYFTGVFGVTVAGNIPLNEQLNSFSIIDADPESVSQMRKSFERPWNLFNTIRTWTSILCFGLMILSMYNFRK